MHFHVYTTLFAVSAMLQILILQDISAWSCIGSDPTITLISDMLFVGISI